jgi:hypothetical protein
LIVSTDFLVGALSVTITSDLITRIDFEVRPNGLYARTDVGEWLRVAKRLSILNLAFRNGQIKITEAAIPTKRERVKNIIRSIGQRQDGRSDNRPSEKDCKETSDAVMAVRTKLEAFYCMLDLTKHRSMLTRISRSALDNADGFKARVPGIGQALVIKPDALRNWLPNSVSVRQAVRQLNASGYLIRGCDGKLTRQVKLWGLPRRRYYCFMLGSGQLKDGAASARLPKVALMIESQKSVHPIANLDNWTGSHRPRKPVGPFEWND